MPLTYIEASVFAAWALEHYDPKHPKADKIVDEIDSGHIEAITSTLAVLEVVDAIRRRVAEGSDYTKDPSLDPTRVKNEIERIIEEFLDGLTALAVQEKIIWADPESEIDEMFQSALSVLLTTFGSLNQTYRNFKSCYDYHGVGQCDVQHSLIAKAFGADELLTFDRAFSQLGDHPDFAKAIVFKIK
jgi:predicted nucleic acid-binding protein